MRKKFKTFMRSAGVLLNVSSLPGEYGIGCFSKDAEVFANLIADMGFHWWQVLPILAIGAGNSPYSGVSSFAGNRLYICPQELNKEGLLTFDEVQACKYGGEPFRTDYDFARMNAQNFLHTAFLRVGDDVKERIDAFRKENADWIEDYALFMALLRERSSAWWKWDEPLKRRDPEALKQAREKYREEIDFYVFEQYEFFRQWRQLKEKVNRRGVSIIGDLPFYVATDSADAWAHPEDFQLDDDLFPRAVAGVPKEGDEAGQVWGNVLYDFDAMRSNGYRWWRARIKHALGLYDALRLDHFRGFYDYYAIPAVSYNDPSTGRWEKGPADDLLDLVHEDSPDALFIAEDLGMIDEDCRRFIDEEGISTMRVFQYGFDGTPSTHIPFRYEVDNVAYTGTHDTNTTLGWLYELNEGAREYVLRYCGAGGAGWGAGGPNSPSLKAIMKTVCMSSASLAIFPFQDMLGYGGDTRMNVPGSAQGNWEYRLPYHLMSTVDRDFFLDMIKTYGREGRGKKP